MSKKLQLLGNISNKGSVLYNEPQDLTEEQKAQARENIGFEEAIMKVMVDLNLAPVILDSDGSVLTDENGYILLNQDNTSVEDVVLETMLALNTVPVTLDRDGSVLTDNDALLLNV